MGHDCFLCGRSARESRSLYMIIDCDEQEHRVRNGYSKRYEVDIAGSLIGKEVHRKCYRSIIHTQQLARYRSTSNPRKYRRRAKKNSSQSKPMDTVDVDKSVNSVRRCLSSSVSDEEENCGQTERFGKRTECDNALPTSSSNSHSSRLFSDLTNKTVDKLPVIMGTTDSAENIGDQSENDETDWIAQSRSLDDPVQVTFHFDSGESASADNVIGRQNNSFENFFEKQISIDEIDCDSDRDDDEPIAFDPCSNPCAMKPHGKTSVGSALPFTSTGKSDRLRQFDRPRVHTFDEQEAISSDSDCSIRCTSRNERNPLNSTLQSWPGHRRKSRSPRVNRNGVLADRARLSDHSCGTIGQCDPAARLFSNGFDELCEWLLDLLEKGFLVPLVEIGSQYEDILERRDETFTDSMLRTTNIRNRLNARYPEKLHFEKISNYEGVVVSLSDVSTYVRLAMSASNVWTAPAQDERSSQKNTCEEIMNAADQLRRSIRSRAFLFRKFNFNRQSIVEFDSALFWSYVPTLLKNVVGLLTVSEHQFQRIKNNHGFYELMTKDLFIESSKCLKIASIAYDIINAQDEKAITPKHLLLGSEIFHHTRSAKLLKMTSRLGHTCGYDTVLRLHQEAAKLSRESSNPIVVAHQQTKCCQQHFFVKVADNFDLNPDGIHGNVNNIHILNQILVSTSENDEILTNVQQLLDDMVNDVIKSMNNDLVDPALDTTSSSSLPVVSASNESYSPFRDESFRSILLGYGLAKFFVMDTNRRSLPLLAGFFATHLPSTQRPLHMVSFLTPINDDPSSESTAEACLLSTVETLLSSKHQHEAVVVVDEKIYRSCVKVKRRRSNMFKKVFIYAGDFHLMKNTMIMIWGVLDGSGVEEIIGLIYKGASLRSVLNVHHFNKSLRCCKLVYTGLLTLLLESFFATRTNELGDIESILSQLPNEFSRDDVKREWFSSLVEKIHQANLHDDFRNWCLECGKTNATFRLWSFVTFSLLEPLIELYIAIRTSNFNARNAAVSRIAPLFFSTNHRNYARLCAQHLVDLKRASSYLLARLARAFAVNRSNRPFSFIALDQTIECTINKYGKSHGGVDGRSSEHAIDRWTHSFSFRALASTTMHEICQLQTAGNSIDSHAECGPQRQYLDHQDLSLIVRNLRGEDLFNMKNGHCRKLRSGMILHTDIVQDICTLHERGSEALIKYIDERLVDRIGKIDIDAPLKAMPRLRFVDAGSYEPSNSTSQKKNQPTNMVKIMKDADEEIRRVVIIAQQRGLPLTHFLAHEFAPTSFALCDSRNGDLLYQASKAVALQFLRELYPSAFQSSYSCSRSNSAIVIDGGSLLEMRPNSTCRTIRDYARQLLRSSVGLLFQQHRRIDVVFDSGDSKVVKMFTTRHAHDVNISRYQLKGSDKLESPFSAFVHSNRAALATCVRECWCEPASIEMIPPGCVLVIGGPEKTAIKLENGLLPAHEDSLESNHFEADTRMMLHVNILALGGEQKTVVIQSSDTDVVLLTVAFASTVCIDHILVKSFNTSTRKNTIIDARSIAYDMRRRLKIDPVMLLILHGLSGCDTTSFVKGITKKKFFSTFFNNPTRYNDLIGFASAVPPKEAISAAEQLLIDCYSSRSVVQSLDELRANMASQYFKERGRKTIVEKLPPSSTAFYYHCLRASRQIVIWLSSFQPYMNSPAMASSGYQPIELSDRFKIRWSSLPDFSDDPRLVTCGQCSTGCGRCKCGTSKLSCTMFCQCKDDVCTNRSGVQLNGCLQNSNKHPFDESDEDSPVETRSILASECEFDSEDQSVTSSVFKSETDWSDADDGYEMNCLTSHRQPATTDRSSAANIHFDHSYCGYLSNESEQIVTPKRRKTSDHHTVSSITLPSSTNNTSSRILAPNSSGRTSFDASQTNLFQSPRPKARFLKHYRIH